MMISPFQKEDALEVLSIRSERGLSRSLGEEDLQNALVGTRALALVEREGRTILGYAFCSLEGEEAEIDSIAVRKEAEGKGIGRALLEGVRQALQKRGVKRILLEVRADDERAKRFYEKAGFVPYRIRKGYYGGVDAICMERGIEG